MEWAVELASLNFHYQAGRPVLQIKEWRVPKGRRIFLFGPSGTGKSTLLSLLAGLLPPQQGTLKVLGQDFARLSPSALDRFRAENIGYIFQQYNLVPHLNVRDNILLPLLFLGRKQDAEDRLRQLGTALGLEDLWRRPAGQLSVGQQQRVAVARAFLQEPPLILADEPTSALDSRQRDRFVETLIRLAEASGSTILCVSHDQALREAFQETFDLSEQNEVYRHAAL
jgi:putative ABC transport system ATP-binding protein